MTWAALALACASERADVIGAPPPLGPHETGGQTGSLMPICRVAPLSSAGVQVPAGDAVAVVYTDGCPEGVDALALLDAGGGRVAVRSELLDGNRGIYLVRSEALLESGEYELSLSMAPEDEGSSAAVRVAAEASDLPMTLGNISGPRNPDGCGYELTFELRLSPEALAYAPLLRVAAQVDELDWGVVANYGALNIENGTALLTLPTCTPEGCIDSGLRELELRATIAGEEGEAVLVHSFEVEACADAAASAAPVIDSPGGNSGCSIRTPESSEPNGPSELVGALFCLLLTLQRRRGAGRLR